MTEHKKLIEVAMPLEAINAASAREKSIRHGHPSTLHIWWARRPLAACRAVLFAQLVDDPSSHPELFPTEEEQEAERNRLFDIIKDLVQWKNTSNRQVLEKARAEIRRWTGGNPPPVLDPFCGGGSIPLEAQRLGLEAHAGDLNPVAVLITKALIEIPPKFSGRPPVNPEARRKLDDPNAWVGARGLAEDMRYYGKWIRAEAEKRIGPLYPKVRLPKEYGGEEATVIAWLWARTVRCPNPACGAQMPLVRSFWLSTKAGKKAWVEPQIDRTQQPPVVKFEARTGAGVAPQGTVNRRGATCICCGAAVPFDRIRSEGKAGRIGAQLMALVAEGQRGRVYLSPDGQHEHAARGAHAQWRPDAGIPDNPGHTNVYRYGLTTFGSLFTPRQLVALTTFSDLVSAARQRVLADARRAGMPDDGKSLEAGGSGASAYSDAVATYLALVVDRMADHGSTIATWICQLEAIRNTFARQAIPMTWDFAEANPFSESTGNFLGAVEWVAQVVDACPAERCRGQAPEHVRNVDARVSVNGVSTPVISTDPPYYDNIGYADLSDFFYIWLRRSLRQVYPSLFQTVLTPKREELVATPYRFGGSKERAKRFFESGLRSAFENIRQAHDNRYPLTIYYAFKQSESEQDGDGESQRSSTGWETFLQGLVDGKFQITATWPMRTERGSRSVAIGTNALASSIVLSCRPRPDNAPLTTRQEFLQSLKRELPRALRKLQQGGVAPVDLAQAAIGPGMKVFSQYSRVLEADGSAMPVRTALALINQVLDEVLAEREGDYDSDTRWAVSWFEQHGFGEGSFGDAETLSKAKNTSIRGLQEAGILWAQAGKVRLLRRQELPKGGDPSQDPRPTVWEATHHLIRALLDEGGEQAAAELLVKLGGLRDPARDLAYRLYAICDRKKWAEDALGYNSLVVSWPAIQLKAADIGRPMAKPQQGTIPSFEVK